MSLVPRKSRLLSPFDDLFNDDMNSLLEGFFLPVRQGAGVEKMSPRIDIKDQEGAFLIKADLPGLKKEDIEVSLHEGLLTITGTKEDDHKEEAEGELVRRERFFGKFSRTIPLGSDIDAQQISATFEDGVLTIRVPKLEQQSTKKISVDIL